MNTITEFLVVLGYCLVKLAADPKLFTITLVGAVFLAIACWVLCSFYTKLWNLRYHLSVGHHILCAIAAVFTLVFTFSFVSIQYTEQITVDFINFWKIKEIKADSAWQQATFRKTYEAVKALNIEDFTNYPDPDHGGQLFPNNQQKTRETTAVIYANESIKHFQEHHPYLSKILWSKMEISRQLILNDNNRFFETHRDRNRDNIYNLSNAVALAADNIAQGLREQASRIVKISRIVIAVLFFIVQAIPLSLIGYAAYKDLKVIT